ncbi:hypothetical protein U5922_009435 [Aquicoccus sp. G2-2]|uniref:hypothetical protein n=1 Tax=Aquicoccus sp. G2-2 TaxID=3092120 RepID=UPI002AE08A35|nr:hypothetical protein [Aquicoccus sp. G2-2]MEA1113690.1 hypothetical protein [Aquicoccus sp. G2-2]
MSEGKFTWKENGDENREKNSCHMFRYALARSRLFMSLERRFIKSFGSCTQIMRLRAIDPAAPPD